MASSTLKLVTNVFNRAGSMMCDTLQASVTKWDLRFLRLAREIASWSSDPGRRVGAVVVGPHNEIRATGYNGLPRGISEKPERLLRDAIGTKYLWSEHAERNAVFNAARNGVSLEGCSIYVTLFPCADCARAILQSGIKRLICFSADQSESDYFGPSWKVANEMLLEGHVEISTYEMALPDSLAG